MRQSHHFDLTYIERLINVLRATSSGFCPNIRRAVLDELMRLNREMADVGLVKRSG